MATTKATTLAHNVAHSGVTSAVLSAKAPLASPAFTGNTTIPDGGTIGSASDTDAITISSTGKVTTADTELNVKTTSHTFTVKGVNSAIGDSQSGTAPDTSDSDSGQFAVYNGSTKLFGITEHGYVLKPKAIWFRAYNGATHNPFNAIQTVEFSSCDQDSSNSYNTTNDYFTAPVGGAYYFCYYFMNNDDEYCRHSFFINDVYITDGQMFAANRIYAGTTNFLSVSLNAGDNVRIKVNINGVNEGNIHSNFRVFTGFLIG